MKRTRTNGGARDVLWEQGMIVLSGSRGINQQLALEVLGKELTDDDTLSLPINIQS